MYNSRGRGSRSGGGDEITFEPHLFFILLDAAREFSYTLDKVNGTATPRRGHQQRGFEEALKRAREEDKQVCARYDEEGRTQIAEFDRPSPAEGGTLTSSYQPKLIGSYSWREGIKSEITIPGLFRQFQEPKITMRGIHLNAAEHPYVDRANLNSTLYSAKLQLEPLFIALLQPSLEDDKDKSDFKLDDFDFVTDRNNLRKLFGWASGRDMNRWRIDLERFNNTILMLRFDLPTAAAAVDRDRIATCFESCCTTNVNEDTSFRAIIKSQFGPHRLLMRCEIDAVNVPEEELLVSGLSALDVQDKDATPKRCEYSGSSLKIQLGKPALSGLDVQHFVEIKSKKLQTWNKVKGDTFAYSWPQLFFAGVDHVFVGIRDDDTITQVLKLSQADVLRHSDFQNTAAVEKPLKAVSDVMSWLASKLEDGCRYSLMFEPLDNLTRKLSLFKRPATAENVSAVPEWLREYLKDPTKPKPRPHPCESTNK